MNTEVHGLKHKELTGGIIGVFFEVYDELGHGFLESVYQKCLEFRFGKLDLAFARVW